MVKVVFDLNVAALLALARCDGCLDAHLMAQRAEEWLELCDCPVVGLGGRGYRLAAVHMVGVGVTVGAEVVLSTVAKHARVVHQSRNRHAKGPREEGLPEVEGPVGTIWCLFFVLIRQGLRGGSGPQRWIRALGEETGNPIMAFHRPSFFPSVERAPHHTTTENPLLGGDPLP